MDLFLFRGQKNAEPAASAVLVLADHPAVLGLDNHPAQGEANAHARGVPGDPAPVKPLPDFRQLLLRDAGALVPNVQPQVLAVPLGPNPDF